MTQTPAAGACKFDLRFVPNGQGFQERAVRDVATGVPDGYEPPNFQTKASPWALSYLSSLLGILVGLIV